jgi:hypothetical protein
MNPPLYFLSTQGTVTGPFAPEQIRGMWQSGSITADAQICPVGAEDWQPAQSIAQSAGNLTALGRAGVIMFTAMALPLFSFGILGFCLGFFLLLLSGLCVWRARSVTAPAASLSTWIISISLAGAAIMAILSWLEALGIMIL